jgi:hypothetical protein
MGLPQLLLQVGQALGLHGPAAAAARDGEEIRRVDIDPDLGMPRSAIYFLISP